MKNPLAVNFFNVNASVHSKKNPVKEIPDFFSCDIGFSIGPLRAL